MLGFWPECPYPLEETSHESLRIGEAPGRQVPSRGLFAFGSWAGGAVSQGARGDDGPDCGTAGPVVRRDRTVRGPRRRARFRPSFVPCAPRCPPDCAVSGCALRLGGRERRMGVRSQRGSSPSAYHRKTVEPRLFDAFTANDTISKVIDINHLGSTLHWHLYCIRNCRSSVPLRGTSSNPYGIR